MNVLVYILGLAWSLDLVNNTNLPNLPVWEWPPPPAITNISMSGISQLEGAKAKGGLMVCISLPSLEISRDFKSFAPNPKQKKPQLGSNLLLHPTPIFSSTPNSRRFSVQFLRTSILLHCRDRRNLNWAAICCSTQDLVLLSNSGCISVQNFVNLNFVHYLLPCCPLQVHISATLFLCSFLMIHVTL